MITMLSFVPLWALENVIDDLYVYFATNYKELRKVLWHFEGGLNVLNYFNTTNTTNQ